MTSPWTDDLVVRLIVLWSEGVSTGLIGKKLEVSKGAVIGKAHRMGLPGRPSPILRHGTVATRRNKALARATVQSEAVVPVAPLASERRGQPTGVGLVRRRWQVSQAQARAERKIRRENGLELLPWSIARQFLVVQGMRFTACQWISGQPSADDAGKCGEPIRLGSAYCETHHTRCHIQNKRSDYAW